MRTTEKPTLQNFHIEGVKHIIPTDALQAIEKGEAVLIDVRELSEVRLEKIPLDRVLNHPMSVIMDRLPYISKDQHIILICQGGVRSVKVANLLLRQDYPNVANLDGGFMMWKAKGLPYESSISFGCSCNSRPAAAEKKPSFQELLGGGLRLDVQKTTPQPIPTPLKIIPDSTITCPNCGHQKTERMPEDSCQFFYECENCHTVIKPKHGDCCVYCSYGDVPCPPIQQNKKCC